jgi:hypothetical protein
MTEAAAALVSGASISPATAELVVDYASGSALAADDLRDQLTELAPDVDLTDMQTSRWKAAVQAASYEDFERARADALVWRDAMRRLHVLVALVTSKPARPIELVSADDETLVYLTFITLTRRYLAANAAERDANGYRVGGAFLRLLETLPVDLWPLYLADADIADLTPEQRQAHHQARSQFAVDFPAESRLFPYHPE